MELHSAFEQKDSCGTALQRMTFSVQKLDGEYKSDELLSPPLQHPPNPFN